MLTDEKKKRIESLSTDEMLFEINRGRRSRFQRDAFAYLKTCYQKRLEENKQSSSKQSMATNETSGKTKIFLSYSWKNSTIADALDILFKTKNIQLERDIRDVEYRQSIKEFMKRIRKSDYCLMIISEYYLKSIKCMFEVYEFTKDENYRERILPLVHRDTDIYNGLGRSKYITYWQDKYDEMNISLAGLEDLDKIEALKELRQIENIKRNIGEFLQFISDISNISFTNEINKSDFEKIYSIINPSDTFLSEHKDNDGFFVLNIPRTLHEKVMTWWKQESKGYTDDLRYAKIFTKKEIEERMEGVNWTKKFAAIPIHGVAVKLGQNYIPFNWRFKEILLENKDKIIGNKNLYLSKEDIEYLI